MFITDLAWKIEGVPQALLAPAMPWHSVLLDISEPCFAVMPRADSPDRANHIRVFSDIAQLMEYGLVGMNAVYAISNLDDQLCITNVTAIGSYPCPQTGIKNYVYVDDLGSANPAHGCQPYFRPDTAFNIEFVAYSTKTNKTQDS